MTTQRDKPAFSGHLHLPPDVHKLIEQVHQDYGFSVLVIPVDHTRRIRDAAKARGENPHELFLKLLKQILDICDAEIEQEQDRAQRVELRHLI